MVVITLTTCPTKLRGDMTKWFMEIDTGVYVGNVSARIRELIWKRITDYLGNGRAVMVYSTANEQRFDIRLHNAKTERADYDGMILTRFPVTKSKRASIRPNTILPQFYGLDNFISDVSVYGDAKKKAYKRQITNGDAANKNCKHVFGDYSCEIDTQVVDYTVIDIETGGLDCKTDPILEVAAIRVREGNVSDTYCSLIAQTSPVTPFIRELTGISDGLLAEKGRCNETVLKELIGFIGDDIVLGHNVNFDIEFIREKVSSLQLGTFSPRYIDTLAMVKKAFPGLKSYSLKNLLLHFKIPGEQKHRALEDAELTRQLFEKVNTA